MVAQSLPETIRRGEDLHEADEAFTVELDLPGVNKGDITIDISGRRVMVHGSRTAKERQGTPRSDGPLDPDDRLVQVRGRTPRADRRAGRHRCAQGRGADHHDSQVHDDKGHPHRSEVSRWQPSLGATQTDPLSCQEARQVSRQDQALTPGRTSATDGASSPPQEG